MHGFTFMVLMSILVRHVHKSKAIPKVPSHSERIFDVTSQCFKYVLLPTFMTLLNLKLSGVCKKVLQNRLRS